MLAYSPLLKVFIRLALVSVSFCLAFLVIGHSFLHLAENSAFLLNTGLDQMTDKTRKLSLVDGIIVHYGRWKVPEQAVHGILQQMIKEFTVDMKYSLEEGRSPWKIADEWVTPRHVIPENAPELGAVLHAMATANITSMYDISRGTQLKFNLTLEGGQLVLFKPKSGQRDQKRCNKVRKDASLLLDIVDTSVFDYLIGNTDRYQIEKMDGEHNGMFVMLDNANSVGDPFSDIHSILAPLYQCCRIRYSTWERLQLLGNGGLGLVLREVLKADPINPVLADAHFQAMDRRMHLVVMEMKKCISTDGMKALVRNDTMLE